MGGIPTREALVVPTAISLGSLVRALDTRPPGFESPCALLYLARILLRLGTITGPDVIRNAGLLCRSCRDLLHQVSGAMEDVVIEGASAGAVCGAQTRCGLGDGARAIWILAGVRRKDTPLAPLGSTRRLAHALCTVPSCIEPVTFAGLFLQQVFPVVLTEVKLRCGTSKAAILQGGVGVLEPGQSLKG